jgi:hypothetical protein
MLDYVREYGGHVELWIRSSKHPDGATRLTKPLREQIEQLGTEGKATLKFYP